MGSLLVLTVGAASLTGVRHPQSGQADPGTDMQGRGQGPELWHPGIPTWFTVYSRQRQQCPCIHRAQYQPAANLSSLPGRSLCSALSPSLKAGSTGLVIPAGIAVLSTLRFVPPPGHPRPPQSGHRAIALRAPQASRSQSLGAQGVHGGRPGFAFIMASPWESQGSQAILLPQGTKVAPVIYKFNLGSNHPEFCANSL